MALQASPTALRSTCAAAVIIGNHTQGLGVVRSAADACDSVWVVNDSALALSRFSRHLTGYRRVPAGTLRRLDEPGPAGELMRVLLDLPVERPSVLFGVDEDITAFIHRHREVLRHRYFVPDLPLEKIYDKYLFNLQLPPPARIDTHLCSETDPAKLDDPGRFIVKGRQGSEFRRITGTKALQLARLTAGDGRRLFERISSDQVIIQEVVDSERPVVSVCSLSVAGDVIGLFGYEKLRQHPSRFGTGTYLRSIDIRPLRTLTEQILGHLGFTGISEIEFIQDRRTGAHKVIEMNPRTWKSVHFATGCGQNLVARYLEFVATGEAEKDFGYTCNRYWADLATDIPEMLRRRKLWGYNRNFSECTWDKRDPGPALALWTLFPLMAAGQRLGERLRRPPDA